MAWGLLASYLSGRSRGHVTGAGPGARLGVDDAAMSMRGPQQSADLLAARMDALLTVPSWPDRLASRDTSIEPSRRAALIVALVSTLVLFVLLTALSPGSIRPPDPVTGTAVLALLGVCLTGGLMIGVWVWLDAAICRHRGAFSLPAFVLFYAGGGALLGTALDVLIPMTGYASTAPPIIRIMSVAAVGPWAAATVAAIQDGRLRIKRAQALLVNEVANVVMSSQSQADLIDDLRAGLHRDLEATLLPAFAATERRLAYEEGLTRTRVSSSAAQILNDLTEASIRPVSKRLAGSESATDGLRAFVALILAVARHQPFRPVAVAGVFLLTVVADRWTVAGLESALISATVGVTLILLILGAGNRLMAAFPQRHGTIFVAFFLLLQVPTYAVEILEGVRPSLAYLGQVALGVLLSGVIIWLTSGVGRWSAPKSELLRLYADEVDAARLDLLAQAEILRSITRQAARILHGSVQSKLAACALALERAIAADDEVAYERAIKEARQVLSEPWPLVSHESTGTILGEEVRRKVALWDGLARITLEIDPGLDGLGGPESEAVAEIVEEGLCNAIRHGGARSIAVGIIPITVGKGCSVHVEVVDDGRGLVAGPSGLGSAYLDEACAGNWTRQTPEGGGCRLQAWVPLPQPAGGSHP